MSERQKKVDKFLRAATVGTVAIAAFPILHIMMLYLPEEGFSAATLLVFLAWFLAAIAMLGSLVYSFGYMFLRRATDEFTLAMWHSGTSFAFFAAIAWLLVGDIAESVISGLIVAEDPARADPGIDIIADWALPVIVAAFFIGFHAKRTRG